MDAPLLPPSYAFLWSLVAVVAFTLLVLAARAQARDPGLTANQRLVSTVFILIFPIVGPTLWFASTTPVRRVGPGDDPTGTEWHSRRALR